MAKRKQKPPLATIGWREWVGLPDLGIDSVKAKIDTGARTSSLHAYDIEEFTRGGHKMVRFTVHPEQRSTKETFVAEAPLIERRNVRPSTGHAELRYVVVTNVTLLGQTWEVELTLTRRDHMGFRMLLGRQAIRRRFLVDSGVSFLGGKRLKSAKRPKG